MKKIIIVGVFVFAFALTANVAFGYCGMCGWNPCPCPETNINQSNNGSVFSTTKAAGITGLNSASSLFGSSSVFSGATNVGAESQNQVGSNEAKLQGVTAGSLNVKQSNNGSIFSTTKAAGITGLNKASVGCGAAIVMSGASTVGASSLNFIGSNLVVK